MKFLVIGGKGEVAQKHISAINQLGGKIIICDVDKNYKDFLDKVDVVSICTPNYLHAQMALDALDANKKVVLEKPIATTLEDAERLIKHPKSKDIAVCYQRRFRVGKAVKEVRSIQANFVVRRDPAYWNTWRSDPKKSGGGALINIFIHYFDLIQWWLGKEYEIKHAKIAYRNGIDQVVDVDMDFNGIPVKFLGSSIHHEKDSWIMVNLDKIDVDKNGTHFDVYDQFLNHNNYVTVKEAYTSLKIVKDIYEKDLEQP